MTLPAAFTLTQDPGHAWLLVTASDMAAVGLTEADISPYSYQSGGWRALEEDCDAAVFIEAYTRTTGGAPRIAFDEKGGHVRTWRRFGTKGYQPARIKLDGRIGGWQ